MAKHAALYWTMDQALRDLEVKERFDIVAHKLDSGELHNPHTVWTSERAKHSATPGIRQLWARYDGQWIYEGDNLEDRLELERDMRTDPYPYQYRMPNVWGY